MTDLIDRQMAIVTAVKAAIDWHRLANPMYSIAYCIGEAMRELPSAQPDVPDTNVGDMISRQAAIDEAYAVIVDDAVYDVVQVETLEGLPSVDAVKVVRCYECVWWDTCPSSTITPNFHKCKRVGRMSMPSDGFCSFGERKDD